MGNGKLEVVKWQEGKNLKDFTRESIFDSIQKIDKSVFHENGLSTEQSDIDRYEAYTDSYIFALCDSKIVGYLCYFPITEEFYNSVIEGIKVYDGDIASTDICHLNDTANYIFVLSVAIFPEYQNKGISKQFSKILMEELSKIKIRDMVSYAFTIDGEHFLNVLGLKKCKDMEDDIKLMRLLQIDDNFDLVLAIPCDAVKKSCDASTASTSFSKLSDNPLECEGKKLMIENVGYDNKSKLWDRAKTFCEQIKRHCDYELITSDIIETIRIPLLYGQIIVREDEINDEFIPRCCYNFFCVHSKLIIDKNSSFKNNAFDIIYFIVPDINYQDLTLLLDKSHELWCNIDGKYIDPKCTNLEKNQLVLTNYLSNIGYESLGKIYHIVFSDFNQFEMIKKDVDNNKLFNILAIESYKDKEIYCHQIKSQEDADKYFFDSYAMYNSYEAYASVYSYYYIIKEKEQKDNFYNRMTPENEEDFSSEANILFVLETEIYKITACLVLNRRINEQIKNHDIKEIQKMFESFINTRPLFEKLNYYYLGAQKEADFIYKQFRISDIIADYDRKRELLKSYTEVTNSITTNTNSKAIQIIGIILAFISACSALSPLFGKLIKLMIKINCLK
jgi:N-acetylglutamate synthase-like GNAT family acetyltransferase